MSPEYPPVTHEQIPQTRSNGYTEALSGPQTVLLVGDIHISDKAPSSATESYTEDLLDMLRWIGTYAKGHDIHTIVWAGDIFHHKQPSRTSHATILKMLEVLRQYSHDQIETYIVTGNHDISNDRTESVHEKQPLGVLLAAPDVYELDGWHPTLPIFGVPWQQRWLDEETPVTALLGFIDGAAEHDLSTSLVVTHAPIYPPSTRDEQLFELVPTSGLYGLSAGMMNQGYLYYGHIHEDHGIWEDEGVTYANMGALSRGSLHEYNLEREIKIAAWSPDSGFTVVPVPHKPASEVFKLAEAQEERSQKLSLDAFLGDVGSRTLDISSTESVIAHIRGAAVPARVKARAIAILEEVG